jgi:hypothetical protein
MESARGEERWSTVGCSENVIEASWQALWDSLELPLLRDRDARSGAGGPDTEAVIDSLKREKILTPLEA